MDKILKKASLLLVAFAAEDPGEITGCWGSCVDKVFGVATLSCFECIFQNLINIAIRLGGVIVFIMILIGGFSLLTAGDDPKKVQKAHNTITFAVIGLVLLILAWFILVFIEKFTGVTVTLFKVGD